MKCRSASTDSRSSWAVSDTDGPTRRRIDSQFLRIGEVVTALADQFPGLSASKLRYLEARGLVVPQRSSGGTRRYSPRDIAELSQVLAWQTGEYLPLDVIAQRLIDRRLREVIAVTDEVVDDSDESAETALLPGLPAVAMSRAQIAEIAGVDEDMVQELVDQGLIRRWDSSAVFVSRAAAALLAHGFTLRHLRTIRLSAERELDLVDSLGLSHPQRQTQSAAIMRLHVALLGHALAE